MDTERDVLNYEFTLSPIGAMLSFDLPSDSAAPFRPRGFPSQPLASWIGSETGEQRSESRALALTYPNLPRPVRLVFKNLPEAMTLRLNDPTPFVVCQTRDGQSLRAHFCSIASPEAEAQAASIAEPPSAASQRPLRNAALNLAADPALAPEVAAR